MGLFDGTPLERPVLCERCGSDIQLCTCPELVESEPEVAPEKQRLKLRVEKRKRGKRMTVVSGFSGSDTQRAGLLRQLKDLCGAGGTLVDDQVELQGEHIQRVADYLRQAGYHVKT